MWESEHLMATENTPADGDWRAAGSNTMYKFADAADSDFEDIVADSPDADHAESWYATAVAKDMQA